MNVIITGATKGMGRAIATKFAAAGCNLIICARSKDDLGKMQKEFANRFPAISVVCKVADLEHADEVKDFADFVLQSTAEPDVLVNNAGYFVPGNIFSEGEEILQKMMSINLYSAYHLTRALLPVMMKRKQGHIFNICSIASFKPMPDVGAYGISKFALYGFTRHLREEMKCYNIKVTAVLPGSTYTSSWEESDIDAARLIEANDVAEMVFAASRLSPSAVVEDIIIRPQKGDL